MDGLRDAARDLERKHNALLATVNEQIAVISTSGHGNAHVNAMQQKLQNARDQAEALKRQNLHFLDEIGDRIKREDRMEGLLRELLVRIALVIYKANFTCLTLLFVWLLARPTGAGAHTERDLPRVAVRVADEHVFHRGARDARDPAVPGRHAPGGAPGL